MEIVFQHFTPNCKIPNIALLSKLAHRKIVVLMQTQGRWKSTYFKDAGGEKKSAHLEWKLLALNGEKLSRY